MNESYLVVFAGPNGSGKSTTVAQYLKKDNIPYICPDIIARKLDIKDEVEKYKIAMNEARVQREFLLSQNKSFAFETVMSMKDKIEFLKAAKAKGYSILAVYVTTLDPKINIERIKNRVKHGGHPVPEDKTISRYEKSLKMLPELIKVSDVCLVLDNSQDLIATFKRDQSKGIIFTEEKNGLDEFVRQNIIIPLERDKYELEIYRECNTNSFKSYRSIAERIKEIAKEKAELKQGHRQVER